MLGIVLYHANTENRGEMILKVEYSLRLEEIKHARNKKVEFRYIKERNHVLRNRLSVSAKYCLQMWENLINGRSPIVSLIGGKKCSAFNSTN